MTTVTVVRRVPPPIIGVCGTVRDRAFEAFEATLDWLESTGILVDRYDPETDRSEIARLPAASQVLTTEGDRCLPLILVDGAIACSTRAPTRSQMARIVGRTRCGSGHPS
jgi:hypothetical protein